MGSKFLFYLVILPISKLPYFFLYRLSDVIYFLMYHIIGYRKKVVMGNLKNSFPEKEEKELKIIAKKFYKHFVDLIIESLKNFSISEENAFSRMIHINPEVLDQYYNNKQSVIFAGGHYANWELWGVSSGQLKHDIYGIYKKLSNEFFDKKMIETRGKFGLFLLSTKDVKKRLDELKGDVVATVYGFDQSPGNSKRAYWLDFMNQDTPCNFGVELYSKKYNHPVVYVHLKKLKRGYYSATYDIIFDKPQETEYGEITTKINSILEKDIREEPYLWLWTHRRWKHKRTQEEKENSLSR